MMLLLRIGRLTFDISIFLLTLYAAYACMYLGPTGPIRRWAMLTWLRLGVVGLEYP